MLFIGVVLCIVFLNFDIFPLKAFKGPSAEKPYFLTTLVTDSEQTPQERIQQQRANYFAYVKKVKTATHAKLRDPEQVEKVEEKISKATGPEQAEQLFRVTINPYVPDFILQGNYVIQGGSPSKQYTAYIYPDEWETIGDIYITDNIDNSWTRLQLDQEYRVTMWNAFAPEGKYTPKRKIYWLNNNEFITIVGFAQGTVSKGGELVKVARDTGKAEILYPAYQKLNQEVVDFEQVEDALVLHINLMDANGFCLNKGEIRVPLKDLDTLPHQDVAT